MSSRLPTGSWQLVHSLNGFLHSAPYQVATLALSSVASAGSLTLASFSSGDKLASRARQLLEQTSLPVLFFSALCALLLLAREPSEVMPLVSERAY